MEEITTTCSTATLPNQTAKQPRPFVLAVLLTGILYFGVKPTLPNNSNISVSNSPQTATSLAQPVANAVLQDLSMRSGLPKSALRIVHAKQLTWQDRCLGLSDSSFVCTQAVIPGWWVTVASGSNHWFYRTDASGSVVKLEKGTPSPKEQSGGIAIARNFGF
jgi:hypothetical protein